MNVDGDVQRPSTSRPALDVTATKRPGARREPVQDGPDAPRRYDRACLPSLLFITLHPNSSRHGIVYACSGQVKLYRPTTGLAATYNTKG